MKNLKGSLRARFNLSEQEQVAEYSAHDFGATTTIHGFKHLFSRQAGPISKCIWALWIVGSLIICTIMLMNVWIRWTEDPIIVSLTDKPEPIWEIPFPAITICPETKSKQTIYNFTQIYNRLNKRRNNITEETKNTAKAVAQVCDSHLLSQLLHGARSAGSISIYDELRKIAPTFNETAFVCTFQDEMSECHQFFSEVWTDEGLCFTFNILNPEDILSELVETPKPPLLKRLVPRAYTGRAWNLENGYDRRTEIDPKVFPFEVLGAGNRGAFTIVLRMYENDCDYTCRGPIMGYKVAIHLPGDLPSILSSNHFIRIPIEQETLITFDPKVTRTAESLRDFSPIDRGCFYPSEGTLKYFKEYTQRNCELECLTDHTLKNCNCVKFSMPRDDATPICDFNQLQCVTDSVKSILGEKIMNVTKGWGDQCNCLPACTHIAYNHEISQATFDSSKYFGFLDANSNEMNLNATFTRLTLQAKENYFSATRRHHLNNRSDLIGLCGGILALFFGASLCSILELIIYFISYIINCKKSVSIERRILKNDDLDDTNVMG